MLRAILAAEDAPCPACGYNLRGLTAGACAECGARLRVGVVPADGAMGPWIGAIVACSMAIGFDAVASLLMSIPLGVSLFIQGGPPLEYFVMLGVMLVLGSLSVGALVAVLLRRRVWRRNPVRTQWWHVAFLAAGLFVVHLGGGLLIVLPML
jgi:hypothetical protein